MKPKKRPQAKRRSRRTYADTLWSQLIKIMYGRACFYCKGTSGIESAHIIGRSHLSTRYHVKNGIALCSAHHRAFDTYAIDRDRLILAAIGLDAYEALKIAAQKPWDREYPVSALGLAIKSVEGLRAGARA